MAGCFYGITGRRLCGEEMTSVSDGLSEAGSGHNPVSAAPESAGFSWGNVCQRWSVHLSKAEEESTVAMASGSLRAL